MYNEYYHQQPISKIVYIYTYINIYHVYHVSNVYTQAGDHQNHKVLKRYLRLKPYKMLDSSNPILGTTESSRGRVYLYHHWILLPRQLGGLVDCWKLIMIVISSCCDAAASPPFLQLQAAEIPVDTQKLSNKNDSQSCHCSMKSPSAKDSGGSKAPLPSCAIAGGEAVKPGDSFRIFSEVIRYDSNKCLDMDRLTMIYG